MTKPIHNPDGAQAPEVHHPAPGSDPYEAKLDAWKKRMGVPVSVPDAEALMIAEDATREGADFCMECGEAFRLSEMRLITRTTDPYLQTAEGDEEEPFDEEDRVRMCKACFAEEYGDESDQNTKL